MGVSDSVLDRCGKGVASRRRRMTEHLIGDKWGLYWHMIPRLLDGMGYSEEDVEKLRLDMRRDVQEEEGKYQLFCITIGRKPDA